MEIITGNSTRILSLCALLLLTAHQEAFAQANLDPNDPNASVVLEELTTGQVPSITVGDKTFSLFSYTPAGDMPAAADINVLAFVDDDDNFGITLQGVFQDLPGGDASLATLEFDVTVSDEGQALGNLISDAHLFLQGSGVGADSEIRVVEEFNNTANTLATYDSTLGGNTQQQLFDGLDFTTTTLNLSAKLDISAISNDPSQPARATVIDVSFSQIVVPEPSSAVLLIIAGLGTVARRRNR